MTGPYAHYYFGERVRETLPPWSREIVDREPMAFHIGLRGPDFFFYGEVAGFKQSHELVPPPTTQNLTPRN